MKQRSKFLSMGLAAAMAVGVLAAPALASAQHYHSRSQTRENSTRTSAEVLGAAGLLLLGNHQSTLGTIALGAAALQGVQLQNDIDSRHQREAYYGYNSYDRYGYTNYGSDRYSTPTGYYSDGGYYDQYGGYHIGRKSNDGDYDRDDRNSNKGRDWASSRGEKRGWNKNGRRD